VHSFSTLTQATLTSVSFTIHQSQTPYHSVLYNIHSWEIVVI